MAVHLQKYITANFYTLLSPEFLGPNGILKVAFAVFAVFLLIVEMPRV